MLDLTILSGFQDGADIASIRAAHAAGLQVGGWILKGFRTLSGPHPEYAAFYGAKEHESSDWPPRTEANIRDSDATLLMVLGQKGIMSPGSLLAMKTAGMLVKPIQVIDLQKWQEKDGTARATAQWIDIGGFRRLNCAGNRDRAIEPLVERFLGEVFGHLRGAVQS